MWNSIGLLLPLILFLTGCYDHGYHPKVRNGLDYEVEVTISYGSGVMSSNQWHPCKSSFLGKIDDQVIGLTVNRGDLVILELDTKDIVDMVNQSKNLEGYKVWEINSEGIELSTQETCGEQ